MLGTVLRIYKPRELYYFFDGTLKLQGSVLFKLGLKG